MADQAQLKYNTSLTVNLDVLAVRGAAEPDNVSKFPGIIHEYLDGSISEQISGGRRNISIDFQVMTALNRRKVVDWWLDPDRQIVCLASTPTGLGVQAGSGTITGTRYYRVAAVDIIGRSIACASVSIVCAGSGAVLTWTAVAGARNYIVYRSDDAEVTFDILDYPITNSYTDTGVTAYKTDIVTATLASASTISVITINELQFNWMFETELARMLTIELREASIFLSANKFPI